MHYCHWCNKRIEGYPAELTTTSGVKEKFHAGPLRDCASAYEKSLSTQYIEHERGLT
jgi:hypothetical protein